MEDTCYWYHAVDFAEAKGKKVLASKMAEVPGMRRGDNAGAHERKMLSSEFGDDWDAIPAYEQIYALAGPTQTYRITGDPKIRKDIDRTLNMFNRYYRDYEQGGYTRTSTRSPSTRRRSRSAVTVRARTGTRSATTRRRT